MKPAKRITPKPEVRSFHVSFDVEFIGLDYSVTTTDLREALSVDFDDISYAVMDRLLAKIRPLSHSEGGAK